mgnify:CR=1 FL=1
MTSAHHELTSHPWFFCGIGGSGLLPLALILKGHGAQVAGSDRSRDQGRTPEKFAWLESLGFDLHPQDGSGITGAEQTLVASAAVEDTVPEVIRAKEFGCPRMSRAQLLAALFNGLWAQRRNLADNAVLAQVLGEAGFDPAELQALATDSEVKAALKQATEEAVERGVFGAPTCFVEGQMYFGQDRLDFVEDALRQQAGA